MLKSDGIKKKRRGYTSLSKNDLIQTILYHRSVVKRLWPSG